MAGFILQYGSYQHQAGECGVAISREAILNAAGWFVGCRERWSFNPLVIWACLQTEKWTVPLLSSTQSFNPLFIGACLQTFGGMWLTAHIAQVSIPSSSGHVCRRMYINAWGEWNEVSIPSSSGHVCRPGKWSSACTLMRGFNPLFIGACLQTPQCSVHYHNQRPK